MGEQEEQELNDAAPSTMPRTADSPLMVSNHNDSLMVTNHNDSLDMSDDDLLRNTESPIPPLPASTQTPPPPSVQNISTPLQQAFSTPSNSPVPTSVTPTFMSNKIKRYMCGLCNVQFANRSNVVRHLGKLHQITKDDPGFKEMLIKLVPNNTPTPTLPNNNKVTIGNVTMSPPEQSLNDSDNLGAEEALVALAANAVQGGFQPTTSPYSVNSVNSNIPCLIKKTQTPKEFMCTICSIGFTKRNNAARHVQQQHNIPKGEGNFAQFIARIKPEISKAFAGTLEQDDLVDPFSGGDSIDLEAIDFSTSKPPPYEDSPTMVRSASLLNYILPKIKQEPLTDETEAQASDEATKAELPLNGEEETVVDVQVETLKKPTDLIVPPALCKEVERPNKKKIQLSEASD